MAETFEKINDYTLQVKTALGTAKGDPALTRHFNFASRQITTIYERGLVQSFGGNYSSDHKAIAASFTSQMHIESFKNIESKEEIALMHGKLIELGGKPPDMPDILTNRKLRQFPKDPG